MKRKDDLVLDPFDGFESPKILAPNSPSSSLKQLLTWGVGVSVNGLICEIEKKTLPADGVAVCEHGVYVCPDCIKKIEGEKKDEERDEES